MNTTDKLLTPDLVEQLAIEYVGRIKKMATRFTRRLPPHIRLDELVSIGNEALVDCFKNYVESNEVFSIDSFRAYARRRVHGAMLDFLRQADPLSRDLRRIANSIDHAQRALAQRGSFHPTLEELAEAMSMAPKKLAQYREEIFARGEFENVQEVAEGAADERRDCAPDVKLDVVLQRAMIVEVLQKLKPNERTVVECYYYRDMTLREIGCELGVTEARICQILKDAHEKLRELLIDEEPHARKEKGSSMAMNNGQGRDKAWTVHALAARLWEAGEDDTAFPGTRVLKADDLVMLVSQLTGLPTDDASRLVRSFMAQRQLVESLRERKHIRLFKEPRPTGSAKEERVKIPTKNRVRKQLKARATRCMQRGEHAGKWLVHNALDKVVGAFQPVPTETLSAIIEELVRDGVAVWVELAGVKVLHMITEEEKGEKDAQRRKEEEKKRKEIEEKSKEQPIRARRRVIYGTPEVIKIVEAILKMVGPVAETTPWIVGTSPMIDLNGTDLTSGPSAMVITRLVNGCVLTPVGGQDNAYRMAMHPAHLFPVKIPDRPKHAVTSAKMRVIRKIQEAFYPPEKGSEYKALLEFMQHEAPDDVPDEKRAKSLHVSLGNYRPTLGPNSGMGIVYVIPSGSHTGSYAVSVHGFEAYDVIDDPTKRPRASSSGKQHSGMAEGEVPSAPSGEEDEEIVEPAAPQLAPPAVLATAPTMVGATPTATTTLIQNESGEIAAMAADTTPAPKTPTTLSDAVGVKLSETENDLRQAEEEMDRIKAQLASLETNHRLLTERANKLRGLKKKQDDLAAEAAELGIKL